MAKLNTLGENIKKYRKRQNLTQVQLAEKLLVSYQAISNWERGLKYPDLENAYKLAEIFQVSLDVLIRTDDLSEEQLMIGIDGGGTKTEFVLFKSNGEILQTVKLTQSNPNDIGLEKCCNILAEGIDILLQTASSVSGIFAGIAGATTGDNIQKISAFLKKRYKLSYVRVDTDATNVISCNNISADGMALICGTGSVLFVRQNGVMHRIGGWGYLFDESGSAYDIGKDAIRAALAHQDGLGQKTLIKELLEEELKGELWDCLNTIYNRGKSYIASLAPVVFEAAALNDEVAHGIIRRNAKHLAELINAATEQYHCGNSIVACGGLFDNCKEILLPIIREYIGHDIDFIFPEVPPVYGACVECCRMMKMTPDMGFYHTFYQEYKKLRG